MMINKEAVMDMRSKGKTLQEIGDNFGVTRERIRQILEKCPKVEYPYYSSNRLGELFNCHYSRIFRVAEYNGIKPKMIGKRTCLFTVDQVKDVCISLLDGKICRVCGERFDWDSRQIFCSEKCRLESHRYINRSSEAKDRHNIAVDKWNKKNPELFREIQNRALRKYYLKNMKGRKYLVVYGDKPPAGSIVEYNVDRSPCSISHYMEVIYRGREYCIPCTYVRIIEDG